MPARTIDPQEQPDAVRELFSHRVRLPLAVGLSEQQPACRAGWPYDNPPLALSVAGQRWRVFDELEAKDIDVEPDGAVVVVDDQSDLLEVHTPQPITANALT